MSATDLETLVEYLAALLTGGAGLLLARGWPTARSAPTRFAGWMLLATAAAHGIHATLAAGLDAIDPSARTLADAAAVTARMTLAIGLLLAVIDHEERPVGRTTHTPRLGIWISVGAALVVIVALLVGMPPIVVSYGGIPRPVAIPPAMLLSMALGHALFARHRSNLLVPRPALLATLVGALASQVIWAAAGATAALVLVFSTGMLALAGAVLLGSIVAEAFRSTGRPEPKTETARSPFPSGSTRGAPAATGDSSAPTQLTDLVTILLESCDDALFLADAQGRLTALNSPFTRLTGYPAAELLGTPLQALDAGCDQQPAPSTLWPRLQTEGSWRGDVWQRHRDGTLLATEYSVRKLPVPLAEGSCYLGVVIDRNIERRVLAAEQMLNELLRLGLQSASLEDCLQTAAARLLAADWFDVDVAGAGFFFSEAAPEVFVLRSGTGLGPDVQVCCHLFAADSCPCRDFIAGSDATQIERPLVGSPGRALCTAVHSGESLLGMLVVTTTGTQPIGSMERDLLRDLAAISGAILELKTTHEKLRASLLAIETKNRDLQLAQRAADEANRLKSEFIANTSHELRTPLNSIIGYLQLVIDGLCDSHDEEAEFVGNALDSGRHLLELINDVLDIAKIEAGKLLLERKAIDLSDVFRRVHTLCSVQAETAGVRLLVPDPPRGLLAGGDAARLRQVLVNLVGNAVKFTDSDGSVSLECALDPDEAQVLITVTDTGIGIPEDKQEAIFESFTQVDGTTTRKYGGTGLGLSISQMLVERMGGWVGVESKPEEGARFTVSLPVWRDADKRPTPARRRPGARRSPRGAALVLQDDALIASEMAVLLEDQGYSVRVTEDLLAAREVIEQLEPALVVTDYGLPMIEPGHLITGWDLVAALVSRTPRLPSGFVFVAPNAHILRRRLTYRRVSRCQLDEGSLPVALFSPSSAPPDRPRRLLVVRPDQGHGERAAHPPANPLVEPDLVFGTQQALLRLRDVPRPYDAVVVDMPRQQHAARFVLEQLCFSTELAGARLLLLDDGHPADPSSAELVFPAFTCAEVRRDPSAFSASLQDARALVPA